MQSGASRPSMVVASIPEFERITTELALSLDRQFFAAQSGHFWARRFHLDHQGGPVQRAPRNSRLITDVKIPENQDAIGRAASYGDLSENSEWEAAIEEQRNLTSRAKQMEEELRQHRPDRKRSHPLGHGGPRHPRALPRTGER